MVTESAVTCSTIPVVIPHSESHPCLGGKMLQSQPGVVGWLEETGSRATGVMRVGWVPGVVFGTEGDVHALRYVITQATTDTRTDLSRTDLPGFDIRTFFRVDLCISTTRCK